MPLYSQPVSELYSSSICLQRSSTELVVYSARVHQTVVVAWPERNGIRILPENIRSWLRRHGLFWCCFCPLASGDPASCQIVNCKDGTVKAYCTDFPSKCGFHVDLTNIYNSALLTSEYPHLPTLASRRNPDIDNIVLAFQSNPPSGPGPYFEGYCGEHVSWHPGKEQKAGPIGYSDSVPLRHQPYITDQHTVRARQRFTMDLESAALALHADALRGQHATTCSAATRIIKKSKPTLSFLDPETGPSTTPPSSAPIQPESQELVVIGKLQRGEGVFPYELVGLIEQCGICKLFFTGGVLRHHIFVCPSSEI